MEKDSQEQEVDRLEDKGVGRSSEQPPQRHRSEQEVAKQDDPILPSPEKTRSLPHLPMDREKGRLSRHESDSTPRSPAPRQSTQLSRKGPRPSHEFDRRFDGPFGRPSLAMDPRTSSQLMQESHETTSEEPLQPDLPEYTANTGAAHPPAATLGFEPEPPPLNYSLWERKWWILYFWSLVVFDSVVCPVALYFGLWYGLEVHGYMSANTVFSIVTAAVGGMSILEYVTRSWKLWKKNSTCKVIGARRLYFDFFHWNFTLGWIIIMAELIAGTVQENPPPRLLAMCVPSMCFVFAFETLIMDAFRYFNVAAPMRISSIPKGAQVRPGIYSIIEDVVAVDGSGGTDYREKLNRRYEASHMFRAMLRRLGLFWSIGAMVMAVVCTILVFTIEIDAAYTVGWSAPFVWAGVWALITVWYVKKKLKEEKIGWTEEIEAKGLA